MCGITGFISTRWSLSHLEKMTERVAHRGPDAKGYFFDEADGVGLGHRRLSILDLSAAANQPFYSRDGRYVMIYNGEIYNFREVAEKYKLTTRTTSDTEVIIETFAKEGISSIADFNGMFAIVIWDSIDKRLWLIRDRIGIKPLYYYHAEKEFAFASELKAILPLQVCKKINFDSIYNFLHLGYIPGQDTIYRDFYKLKPGSYAILDNQGLRVKSYWKLDDHIQNETLSDEKIAKQKLTELVESSVKYCMISDVSLGIFLSGGVDSSLVAAVAQSVSATPVKTFSIAFKEERFDEAVYARKIAGMIGSEHYEFTATEQEAIDLVDILLDVYDEPYADSSAIPTMLVSSLARKYVKVALSGDGGDELFMGYGFYHWAKRLSNPIISAFRKPIGNVLQLTGNERYERAALLFEYPTIEKRKSHLFSQEQYYFTEKEIAEIMKRPGQVLVDETMSCFNRKISWPEEQSFFDVKNYLPEELLVKTDRASMRSSLEVRVPLLDHRLAEFAINLSSDLKLKGNVGKYLLKEVLYQYLPQSIFKRPKQGFSIPLAAWLKNDLNYLIEKYLSTQVIEEFGIVDMQKVATLKNQFLGGKNYLHTRIWALIILHKWLKEVHK